MAIPFKKQTKNLKEGWHANIYLFKNSTLMENGSNEIRLGIWGPNRKSLDLIG
jgi:hypothetical protein